MKRCIHALSMLGLALIMSGCAGTKTCANLNPYQIFRFYITAEAAKDPHTYMVQKRLEQLGSRTPLDDVTSEPLETRGGADILACPTTILRANAWAEVAIGATNSFPIREARIRLGDEDIEFKQNPGVLIKFKITSEQKSSVEIKGVVSILSSEKPTESRIIPFLANCPLGKQVLVFETRESSNSHNK